MLVIFIEKQQTGVTFIFGDGKPGLELFSRAKSDDLILEYTSCPPAYPKNFLFFSSGETHVYFHSFECQNS